MQKGSVYDSFPTLTTSRLLLRELQPGDVTAIFHIGSTDAVMQWYDLDTFTTIADATAFIARQHRRFAQRGGIRWGLALPRTGQIIGWCGHVQGPYHRLEVGYALDPAFWRQGFMHEALDAIVKFTFQHMDVNRLEATIHPDNVASCHLIEKLRFRAEGTLRDYGFWRGRFHTLVMYALLRSDYYEYRAYQ